MSDGRRQSRRVLALQQSMVFLPMCGQQIDKGGSATCQSTSLLGKGSYINPISFADEPGNYFSGFSSDLIHRRIEYKPPTSTDQLLHPVTASPAIVLRSSLGARKRLAKQLALAFMLALHHLRTLWNQLLAQPALHLSRVHCMRCYLTCHPLPCFLAGLTQSAAMVGELRDMLTTAASLLVVLQTTLHLQMNPTMHAAGAVLTDSPTPGPRPHHETYHLHDCHRPQRGPAGHTCARRPFDHTTAATTAAQDGQQTHLASGPNSWTLKKLQHLPRQRLMQNLSDLNLTPMAASKCHR